MLSSGVDPLRRLSAAPKLARARELRREPTPAERYPWTLLRDHRLLGLKFRRQQALHGFIVDFYCPALKLIIELEGSPHEAPTQTSLARASKP